LFKTPVFKVSEIIVQGNGIIGDEKIIELTGIKIGDNLLKLNKEKIIQNILTNSYIESIEIRRSITGKVYIDVTERVCAGISHFQDKYVTIDKKGVIIEILDNIEGINLPIIKGLNIQGAVPGKAVELSDDRKLKAFNIIIDSISHSEFSGIINEIDVNNLLSVVIKTAHNIDIKIGTIDDIDKKLKVAKVIMEDDVLKRGLTGIIDVSFKGNPVFREYTESVDIEEPAESTGEEELSIVR